MFKILIFKTDQIESLSKIYQISFMEFNSMQECMLTDQCTFDSLRVYLLYPHGSFDDDTNPASTNIRDNQVCRKDEIIAFKLHCNTNTQEHVLGVFKVSLVTTNPVYNQNRFIIETTRDYNNLHCFQEPSTF